MSRKKRKDNIPRQSKEQCYAVLKMYGVPKHVVDAIMQNLIYYAVVEGDNLKYDRIYSGVALMLHRRYHLSGPEILEGLREFDAVCGSVLDKDENDEDMANWHDLMTELRDETGIIVHTGGDDRLVCECDWDEEEFQEVD